MAISNEGLPRDRWSFHDDNDYDNILFELGFIIVWMTYGNADNDQGYGHPKD